jgi:hypothetical protein
VFGARALLASAALQLQGAASPKRQGGAS